MQKIIVYVDDTAFAREHMARLVPDAPASGPRHWIVAACAPRMTHRISKWVSHSARENWRVKWFAKVQAEMTPLLQQPGDAFTAVLATGPMPEFTQQLQREYGAATVLDARRPKIGMPLEAAAPEPVAAKPKAPKSGGWALPGTAIGMFALLLAANQLAD